jgi:hypothetical protein
MPIFGTVSASNPPSFRNILINGVMDIYQRGQTSTGLTGEQYGSADRMKLNINTAGTWSMNVVNDGPTGTGFRNSCNVICTTADTSLASGDYVVFAQLVEGQNLQATKKGSANAESITVSFWAKSSNTGTYVCELYDADNSRQASKSFTINSANTWEREVITFTPDTTGQFDNDNALSLYCQIWMAAGTNFTSGTLSNGSWNTASSGNRAAGQLNLANRVGNYMAITGWQMEIGSVATEFERRPITLEQMLCYRYYYRMKATGNYSHFSLARAFSSTQASAIIYLPVPLRAYPSASYFTPVSGNYDYSLTSINLLANYTTDLRTFQVEMTGSFSGVSTAAIFASSDSANSSNVFIDYSAEL